MLLRNNELMLNVKSFLQDTERLRLLNKHEKLDSVDK